MSYLTSPSGQSFSEHAIEEKVALSLVEACRRALGSAFVFLCLGVGGTTLFFLAANIAGIADGKARSVEDLLFNTVYFVAFAGLFFGAPSLFIASILSTSKRPRRITADSTTMTIETLSRKVCIPLKHLQWKISHRLAFDQSGFHVRQSPLIVISTRSSAIKDGIEPSILACGFTSAAFDHWADFLDRHGIPQIRQESILVVLRRLSVSTVAGAVIGGALGLVIRRAGAIPHAVFGLTLIGLIDGAIVGSGASILQNWQYNEALPKFRRYCGPIIVAAFAQPAAMLGLVGGWRFAVGCAVANAILGYFAFRRFSSIAAERNAELETGRISRPEGSGPLPIESPSNG